MVLKIFRKWQLNLSPWKTWKGHGKSCNMKMNDCSSLMVKRILVRSRLISGYEVLYFSLTFWFFLGNPLPLSFFHAAKKLPTAFRLYAHLKQLSFKAGIYSWNFLLQEGLEGFEEVTNPKGIVLNPETNEDVDMGEWRTSHFGHLTILPLLIVLFFPHLYKFSHDRIDSNWINFEFVCIPDCLFHFFKEAQGD